MLNNIRKITARIAKYGSDRRAAISPMMVLMLIPICGIMALGSETSFWFMKQRALQNAADSAALAAAANNDTVNTDLDASGIARPRYWTEVMAVLKKYQITPSANIQVTPQYNQPCPSPSTATDCYKVTVREEVPLYLSQVVGYSDNGNTYSDGRPSKVIEAVAMARPRASTGTYCLLALSRNVTTGATDTTMESITCKGCSKAEMTGCNVATNGTALCTGHDLAADRVDAGGSSNSCATGSARGVNQPVVSVSGYEALASQIPANGCPTDKSKYNNKDLTGTVTLTSPAEYCGDVTIKGNVTINSPEGGGVMVIRNGNLNIGKTDTLTGSNLTIIFAGPNISGFSPGHTLPGDGTINISAPTSGQWSGVAIYQDPALRSGVNASWSGNKPTWNITGLVFMPYADLSFGGIVNKYGSYSCIALVVNKFSANGTATIAQNQSQCAQAGLTPPSSGAAIRQGLVQ